MLNVQFIIQTTRPMLLSPLIVIFTTLFLLWRYNLTFWFLWLSVWYYMYFWINFATAYTWCLYTGNNSDTT